MLVLLPDGPKKLLGRWLDVDKAAWAPESVRVDAGGGAAMERLAMYVAPKEQAGPPLVDGAVGAAPAPKKKSSWARGASGTRGSRPAPSSRWSSACSSPTKVGDDSLTVTASH